MTRSSSSIQSVEDYQSIQLIAMAFTAYPMWERTNDRKVRIVDDSTAVQASGVVVASTHAPLLRREQTFNGCSHSDPNEYERVMLDRDMYTSRHQADFAVIGGSSTTLRRMKMPVEKHVKLERLDPPQEELFPLRDRYNRAKTMHPAFAASVLREKLAKGEVDVRTILPPECFKFQGQITPEQFRNAMGLVDLTLTDQDFHKLWHSFDRQHSGSVTTRQFMRDVDLDPMGRPNTYVKTSQKKSSVVSLKERMDIVHRVVTEKQHVTEYHPVRSTMITEKSFAYPEGAQDKREGRDTGIEWMFPKLTVVMKSPRYEARKHCHHDLLEKIRHQVLQQREYLKSYFQARDRVGLSHIPVADMKAVMGRLYFPLSDGEKDSLCRVFDFSNNGRFHYLAFMDLFAA